MLALFSRTIYIYDMCQHQHRNVERCFLRVKSSAFKPSNTHILTGTLGRGKTERQYYQQYFKAIIVTITGQHNIHR